MKNLIFTAVILICGTGMAQENPTEVKEEVEVKTVKYKDSDATEEKKVKVVTRETSNVKLDKKDEKKVNQNRVSATKKVEKMVMVDDDADSSYDFLTKETYYIFGEKNYKFSPNNKGFDIAFNNDKKEFMSIGKALATSTKGNYIIKGEVENGIGYFDEKGDFIVEYYDEDSNGVIMKTYSKK